MSHLEKLVVFLDNQNHVLARENKAMMGALMKAQVETNAAICRVSNVMCNVVHEAFALNDTAGKWSRDELIQKLFGPSEDSLTATHLKDWSAALPTDDEVMEEVVFRLNELSFEDVTEPEKPVLTSADLPHAPPRPLGKDFRPNVKELEKFRSPATVQGWEEGEALAICKKQIDNRTPAVNAPIELLKITSKNADIQQVKDACFENLALQPKRRKPEFRPEKRSDKLVKAREEVDEYELGDKNPRRVTRSSRNLRSSSESSNPSRAGFSSPKRKLEEATQLESPKRVKKVSPKKKKKQTARKSTTPTPTPVKTRKSSTPMAPPPSPNNNGSTKEADQYGQDLNDSIVEISSGGEECKDELCVGEVEVASEEGEVFPFDPEARSIKKELIDEAEALKSSKEANLPQSPNNED